MLERLQSVRWVELKHAYGSAADVPDQIRALASGKKKARDQASKSLYGNIFHQGTRYQATPYAIPFLLELLGTPAVSGREEIAYLLVNLALGYEEEYLPDGFDPVLYRRRTEELEARMSATERAECDRYGFGPRNDLACYDGVRAGMPVFVRLTADGDPLVRRSAAYALAWFPEESGSSVPALYEQLDRGGSDFDVANVVLSLGLLARRSAGPVDAVRLRPLLDSRALVVRVAAAIALAEPPVAQDVMPRLVEALTASRELQGLGDHLRFNDGNLAGYAGLALSRGGMPAKAQAVPALCKALGAANMFQAQDLTAALLDLVVVGRTAPITDAPAASLDAVDTAALRSIADSAGWGKGKTMFVNYSMLVRRYGLPDSRAGLMKYLGSD